MNPDALFWLRIAAIGASLILVSSVYKSTFAPDSARYTDWLMTRFAMPAFFVLILVLIASWILLP